MALPTTCALVTTSPRASKTMPDPRSCGVRICTTEGETVFTTRTNCCCSDVVPSVAASGATGTASSAAWRLLPQAATTTAMPARTSGDIRLVITLSTRLCREREVHPDFGPARRRRRDLDLTGKLAEQGQPESEAGAVGPRSQSAAVVGDDDAEAAAIDDLGRHGDLADTHPVEGVEDGVPGGLGGGQRDRRERTRPRSRL